jgi:uncharacterized glyoxalase superfamily protein PhnB
LPLFYLAGVKEKGFIRCNPHLPVKSLRETLDFYREKLGFSDEWIFGDRDGGIRRDEMRLLFGEDPDFTGAINTNEHRLSVMWFTNNIEDIFFEFQSRGIEIAAPLKTHPYGLREFAFIDLNGYYIRVAERVEEEK